MNQLIEDLVSNLAKEAILCESSIKMLLFKDKVSRIIVNFDKSTVSNLISEIFYKNILNIDDLVLLFISNNDLQEVIWKVINKNLNYYHLNIINQSNTIYSHEAKKMLLKGDYPKIKDVYD